jgi:two-component system chemotaxis response regulator CheY
MKILIADDSSVTRKVMKAVASSLQMETEEAENGADALEKLQQLKDEIKLVLLDWNMPEMNGFDLLTKIKGDDELKQIPVMMVTTEGQKKSTVAAIRAGADNYLIKPFSVEELQVKIMECLQEYIQD